MSIYSTMIRKAFKKSDDKRDAGLTSPKDIIRYDDIRYGPDKKENVLDIYRPKDTEGPLPVIVSIHGGGWVYGDKERYQYYCMSLSQQGFAVVNFTYRLAPKHKFPAALEDSIRVFEFIMAHHEVYGLDTDNVFAVGDSAGAQILGLLCCIDTNKDYAKEYPFSFPEGFRLKAIALNCGVYDIAKRSDKNGPGNKLMEDLLPNKGTPEELEKISISDHVTSSFPPSFIMTAEGDFLADQALPFTDLLKMLGAEAEFHYYGDKEHVLGHVFHCNIRLSEAQLCNKEECDFFKRHIKGETV